MVETQVFRLVVFVLVLVEPSTTIYSLTPQDFCKGFVADSFYSLKGKKIGGSLGRDAVPRIMRYLLLGLLKLD